MRLGGGPGAAALRLQASTLGRRGWPHWRACARRPPPFPSPPHTTTTTTTNKQKKGPHGGKVHTHTLSCPAPTPTPTRSSQLLGFVGAARLPGVALPLLSQTLLLWQVALGRLLLRRRLGPPQLAGCAAVAAGVALAAWPGGGGGGSGAADAALAGLAPLPAALFVASMLFLGLAATLKEQVFRCVCVGGGCMHAREGWGAAACWRRWRPPPPPPTMPPPPSSAAKAYLPEGKLDLFVVNSYASLAQARGESMVCGVEADRLASASGGARMWRPVVAGGGGDGVGRAGAATAAGPKAVAAAAAAAAAVAPFAGQSYPRVLRPSHTLALSLLHTHTHTHTHTHRRSASWVSCPLWQPCAASRWQTCRPTCSGLVGVGWGGGGTSVAPPGACARTCA